MPQRSPSHASSAEQENTVIPVMDAGQIGRIADLHGFAARRGRDTDVPNASSAMDGNLPFAKILD